MPPNSIEWLRNLARNTADGIAGMTPQDHPAWEIAAEIKRLQAEIADLRLRVNAWKDTAAHRTQELMEAAAFLDAMVERMDERPINELFAADCRAMARKLRGET